MQAGMAREGSTTPGTPVFIFLLEPIVPHLASPLIVTSVGISAVLMAKSVIIFVIVCELCSSLTCIVAVLIRPATGVGPIS